MNNVIELEGYRFNRQGWINATEAAKRFNKRSYEWLRLPRTKSYIEAMHRQNLKAGLSRLELVETIHGGANKGTWIHPDLAVVFARWLSDDFAVWCDLQIKALLGLKPGLWAQRDRLEGEFMAAVQKASEAGTDLVNHRWHTPPLAQHLAAVESEIQLSLEVS